jgi:hypothetical protein
MTIGAPSEWLTEFNLAVGALGVAFAGRLAGQQMVLENNKNELSLVSWDGTNKVWVGFVLLFGTAAIVARTGFWKRWLFWKKLPQESCWTTVAATFIAVALLTEVFVVAAAMFFAFGIFDLPTEVERSAVVSRLEANFAWNLLDAIPFLDIPKTVHWKLSYTFDDLGTGAFFMLYKILVILPLLGLVAQLLEARRKGGESRAGAAGKSSRSS